MLISCLPPARPSDCVSNEVLLFGTDLTTPGTTFWARMNGVSYQLQV